jgi:protein gp37
MSIASDIDTIFTIPNLVALRCVQKFKWCVQTKHHRYQILTKRASRMVGYFSQSVIPGNVWLGVTVEAVSAKSRINSLRRLQASVRFLSCEPLIEDLGGP